MRIFYIALLTILLGSYWRVLRTLFRQSDGLSPLLGWMVGLAYFVVGPFTLMTLNGGLQLPDSYQVGQRWSAVDLANPIFLVPYLVVWLLLMSVCLVVYTSLPGIVRSAAANWTYSPQRLERSILISMALSLANWALMVWLVGPEQFLVSHWYIRSEDLVARYGDWYVLFLHVSMANQIIFTSAASLYTSLALKDGTVRWRFMSLIAVFFLIEMVMEGNRIFIAIYLLSSLTSCWLFERKRLLALLFAISPLILLVFTIWASLRHNLTEIPESLATYADADQGSHVVTPLIGATEGMSTLLLIHVINDFGHDFDYLYGESYSRAVTSFIPRSIYPQKPEGFNLMLAKQYLPGEVTSVSATAIGEMYANFGPLALVLFPLFTLGVVFCDRWAMRRAAEQALLPSVLFVLFIWMARGGFEDTFVTFVLTTVLILLCRLDKGLTHDRAVMETAA